MTDAQVTFETLDYEHAVAGSEQRFGFACPKKKGRRCEGLVIAGRIDLKHDPQGANGGVPQWQWDGNRDKPTFSPSINCGSCGWHGYLRAGRCVDANGSDEPEVKGMTP